MKYLIASDIHGSAYWAKKLVDEFEKSGADKLILLGDILYHGPRNDLPEDYAPKEVAGVLNTVKNSIYAVRGNCDADVDQLMLDFPILSEYALFDIAGAHMFCTHGHKFGPDSLPPMNGGEVFLFGHIHVPKAEIKNGVYILNPGSVSLPKENSANSYAVLENRRFEVRGFDGAKVMSIELK